MKAKLFTSMVILAISVSGFSSRVLPSRQQRVNFSKSQVPSRNLKSQDLKTNQKASPQLVANTENKSRELHNSKNQKPYNGFQRTRPLGNRK